MLVSKVAVLKNTGDYYQGLGSNTGDGIRMAKDAGAALYDDPWVVVTTMALPKN